MKQPSPRSCELCSLPVEVDGFKLTGKDMKILYFCCEGCKSIFRMLHPEQLADQSSEKK